VLGAQLTEPLPGRSRWMCRCEALGGTVDVIARVGDWTIKVA
jgi:hypothetical protein